MSDEKYRPLKSQLHHKLTDDYVSFVHDGK